MRIVHVRSPCLIARDAGRAKWHASLTGQKVEKELPECSQGAARTLVVSRRTLANEHGEPSSPLSSVGQGRTPLKALLLDRVVALTVLRRKDWRNL